jgi:hypothetical protein
MEYEFHPLADLFPMMSDEEIDALGEDMLANGQRESIALFEEKILDGRNRYLACMRKDIEPRFLNQRPADPVAFVASANLHRRHLDESQRAMIAAKLANMKQGARTDLSPRGEISQAKAATLLHIGKRSVERGRAVLDHGVPDLVDAVEHGEVRVSAAAEFAKQNPPLDQARLIAEHGSPADAVKATVKAKADRAAVKTPKPVPDPKPAADRALYHVSDLRKRLNQLQILLQAFSVLDSLENPVDEVVAAIRRLDDDVGSTVFRLRQLATFAALVADYALESLRVREIESAP